MNYKKRVTLSVACLALVGVYSTQARFFDSWRSTPEVRIETRGDHNGWWGNRDRGNRSWGWGNRDRGSHHSWSWWGNRDRDREDSGWNWFGNRDRGNRHGWNWFGNRDRGNHRGWNWFGNRNRSEGPTIEVEL